MNLNSWDYHEIGKEVNRANMFQLLELFKREDKKYTDKCTELVKNLGKLNEEGKAEIEKEAEFIEGCKITIALKIAERLTK